MSKIRKSSISYSGNIKRISEIAKAKNSFVNNCDNLIISSYFEFINKIKFNLNWDEETFSANVRKILIYLIKKNKLTYFVTRENIIDNEDILKGKIKAKTAKRIDIYFATFQSQNYLDYAIEAKILAENNIDSKNYSQLNAEYIDEGMDRFINRIYDIQGCMLGYVIEGNPDEVILKINRILQLRRRKTDIIGNKHTINKFEYCYTSNHSSMGINHFLFPFALK
jgi:hypothetical protein